MSLVECQSPRALFEFLWTKPVKQQELVSILLYDWWSARNRVNAGDKAWSTEEVCHQIFKHVHEFAVQIIPRVPVLHTPAKWVLPKPNFVNVNFDAAFQETTHPGAWGCVLRSDQGVFLAGASGRIDHVKSALQAEAYACVAAIELAA